MSEVDDEAVAALSEGGLHPAIARQLVGLFRNKHSLDAPISEVLKFCHKTMTTLCIAELATKAINGSISSNGRQGGFVPNLPYVAIVASNEPLIGDETKVWIYRGDDVDAIITDMRERFRPLDLPIQSTFFRTCRLAGKPLPPPVRQPPPPPRRTPAFPPGFTWTDPKTGITRTLEDGA